MLIQWLRNRRWKRRRLIFQFHDGTRIQAIDPIEVSVAIHDHPEFLHRHLKETTEGDSESQAIAARTACDVFGVSPLDVASGTGLTVTERVELMMAFDLYVIALKKNTRHSPTPPSSMESTSNPSSKATTSDTSPSGSIVDDPISEAVTSSELDQ